MRAAMQLRAMTGELGCISVSNIFGIPEVHKAIDEKGTPLNDHMNSGVFISYRHYTFKPICIVLLKLLNISTNLGLE